jgi:DNA-binding CsgD family transcriptional regulator
MVVMRDHPVAAASELQDDDGIPARRATALVVALEKALLAAKGLLAAMEAAAITHGNLPVCPQQASTGLHLVCGQPCCPWNAVTDIRSATTALTIGVEPDAPVRLSQREAEVLRLLAAGQSNRQIARILFISPRTVQRHIANAYPKIGAHNKAEATSFALRHRLA